MDNKENKRILPYIIAVDFDGTLVEDKFPNIGEIRKEVWSEVINAQRHGVKIILWTCRDGQKLSDAIAFCNLHNLWFDAINTNIDEVKTMYNNDTRKVFADEYWDDKSVSKYSTIPLSLARGDGSEIK